jgi:hypothetical protein
VPKAIIPVSFREIAAAYPDKTHYPSPAGKLLSEIGGAVRSNVHDDHNTCAVRLSYAFNHGGARITKMGEGIKWLASAPRTEPGTENWVKPNILHEWYMMRVGDFKKYLTLKYGEPTPIWDGYHRDNWKVLFMGATHGVICFEWKGPQKVFGASGHMDLFQVVMNSDSPPQLVPACVEECYWWDGPMYASLWEMPP